MTRKSEIHAMRVLEKEKSRIKEVKNYILSTNLSSTMNNKKWFQIFEWIDNNPTEIKLKLLLADQIEVVSEIYELEDSSILTNNTGVFIKFLEIDFIEIKLTSDLNKFLNNLNVQYFNNRKSIVISGYR